MHLSAIILAAMPALALAQATTTSSAAAAGTTTCTSTTVLTKTLTLSQVHIVTSVVSNSTSVAPSVTPSVGTTSYFSAPSGSLSTTGAPAPSVKGPSNAAGALDASKVALAGFVGMLAVAVM